MERCIVHNDHGLLGDRLPKGIKTPSDHPSVERLFKHRSMHIIVALHTSSYMNPSLLHSREFNDFTRFWPRRGDGRIQGKSHCIQIVQSKLSVGFWLLQRFEGTLTALKGFRVSQRVYRLSHPFPSKTGSLCETFQRRQTETLLGCVGSSRSHLFERTGVFFDRVLGKLLFVWGELGWSATARGIIPTLGAMLFPCFDPG
jgi:hypothetical protein